MIPISGLVEYEEFKNDIVYIRITLILGFFQQSRTQICNNVYIYFESSIDHHVNKDLISSFSLAYGNEHNQQKVFSFYETAVASLSFQTARHSKHKLVNVVPTEDHAFAEIYFC